MNKTSPTNISLPAILPKSTLKIPLEFRPISANDDGPIFVPMQIPMNKMGTCIFVAALLDLGSFSNLMDERFARHHNFKFLDSTQEVTGVNGTSRAIASVRIDLGIGKA